MANFKYSPGENVYYYDEDINIILQLTISDMKCLDKQYCGNICQEYYICHKDRDKSFSYRVPQDYLFTDIKDAIKYAIECLKRHLRFLQKSEDNTKAQIAKFEKRIETDMKEVK